MDRIKEAPSGEYNIFFSYFSPMFFTGQLMVFFPLSIPSFLDTGSQNWIARVKPPGVSPSLSTALILYMHSVTIIIPGYMPGILGSFSLLQSQWKYFFLIFVIFLFPASTTVPFHKVFLLFFL